MSSMEVDAVSLHKEEEKEQVRSMEVKTILSNILDCYLCDFFKLESPNSTLLTKLFGKSIMRS